MRFEVVRDDCRKFPTQSITLPERQTEGSCGYDIYVNEEKILEPRQQHIFWTDVKVKLKTNEFLMIVPRSSIGIKYNLMLANSVGIIDPSYYGCESNDGNMGICLYNYGNTPVKVERGMRVAQGIVMKYVKSTEDLHERKSKRKGGFGSTSRD